MQHRTWESIVNGTESAIREISVSLPEEPDAENLQVRFCEGWGTKLVPLLPGGEGRETFPYPD